MFTDPFTPEEHRIAATQPVTTEDVLLSARTETDALLWFARRVIVPIVTGQVSLADLELAVAGTFYRLVGLLETAAVLKNGIHFQALAMVARAGFEQCVDTALLCRGLVPNAVEKFHGFTRVARYRLAANVTRFYEMHPELECAEYQPHIEAATRPGLATEIAALALHLWGQDRQGRPITPTHWSGLDRLRQARLVGVRMEESYRRFYELSSWYVHGGAAGTGGMAATSLYHIELFSRNFLKDHVPEAFRDVGRVFHLDRVEPRLSEQLTFIETSVGALAIIDAKLRALGHPSKFGEATLL